MVWVQNDRMAEEQRQTHWDQLFYELKTRFPEVPDNVVRSLMQKNNFVRESCIDALGRESKQYLSHSSSSNSTLPDRVEALHIYGGPDPFAIHRSNSIENQTAGGGVGPPGGNSVGTSGSRSATTPSNEIDVLSQYPPLYVAQGSAENGPFHPVVSSAYSRDSAAMAGGLIYPTQTSQGYHHPHHPHSSMASAGRSQVGYSQQMPSSGPSSVSTQPWQYDQHAPRPPSHFKQPFPMYFPPGGPSPFGSPSSPNTGRSVYYPPQDHTTTPTSQPYSSGMSYVPVPVVSPPGSGGISNIASGGNNSPSPGGPSSRSSAALWYVSQGELPHQPSGGVKMKMPLQHYAVLTGDIKNGQVEPMRRGSEDASYTQALLVHQLARKEKLKVDLEGSYHSLLSLREDVAGMERETMNRRSQSRFPTAEDIAKVREENRRMLIDIQLMTREIDMVNNGQTPLGVIDPKEQNFYENIGTTGQRGSIHAGGGSGDGSENSSPGGGISGSRMPPARPPPPSTQNQGNRPAGGTRLSPADSEQDEGEHWSCSACTLLNHPALMRCECCDMPRVNTSGPR